MATTIIYASLIQNGFAIAVSEVVPPEAITARADGLDIPLTVGDAQEIAEGFRYLLRLQSPVGFGDVRTVDLQVGDAQTRVGLPPDGLVGNIEGIRAGRGFGWVLDVERGRRQHRTAVVVIDGEVIQPAFVERADIEAIAPGGTGSAFTFEFPESARDGETREIVLQSNGRVLDTVTFAEPIRPGEAMTLRFDATADETPAATLRLGSGAAVTASPPEVTVLLDGLTLGQLTLPPISKDDAPVEVTLSVDDTALRLLAALCPGRPLSLTLRAQALRTANAEITVQPAASVSAIRPLANLVAAAGGLLDLNCSGSHALQLRLGNEQVSVLAAQIFPERLVNCPVEVVATPGGPQFASITLASPYAPVLIVLRDVAGHILCIDVLPFPSLCRGGLHGAELRLFAQMVGNHGDDTSALAELSGAVLDGLLRRRQDPPLAIAVIGERSAGAEAAMLSEEVQEWLRTIMHATLMFSATGEQQASADLVIGAQALPSLSALSTATDPAAPLRQAAFALQPRPGDAGPIWLASVPALGGWFDSLQPASVRGWYPSQRPAPIDARPDWAAPWGVAAVEVMRRPSPNLLRSLFPAGFEHTAQATEDQSSPLASPIVIGIGLLENEPTPHLLLESLAFQHGASTMHCIVATAGEAPTGLATALQDAFPGRHELIDCPAGATRRLLLQAAAAGAGDSVLVIAAPTAILHDPTTVQRLVAALLQPRVATVGCALVTGTGINLSAACEGFELVSMAVSGRPQLRFRPANTPLSPIGATTAVIANSSKLMALRSGLIAQNTSAVDAAPGGDAADVAFGLRAIVFGGLNLCVSAVSAYVGTPPEAGQLHIEPQSRLASLQVGAIADAALSWQQLG